jgi:hypothetical protein
MFLFPHKSSTFHPTFVCTFAINDVKKLLFSSKGACSGEIIVELYETQNEKVSIRKASYLP